jgi:hypothetical protein
MLTGSTPREDTTYDSGKRKLRMASAGDAMRPSGSSHRCSVIVTKRVILEPNASISVTRTPRTIDPLTGSRRAAARDSLSVSTWVPAVSVRPFSRNRMIDRDGPPESRCLACSTACPLGPPGIVTWTLALLLRLTESRTRNPCLNTEASFWFRVPDSLLVSEGEAGAGVGVGVTVGWGSTATDSARVAV